MIWPFKKRAPSADHARCREHEAALHEHIGRLKREIESRSEDWRSMRAFNLQLVDKIRRLEGELEVARHNEAKWREWAKAKVEAAKGARRE